jgi:hypothetical protein
MPFCLVSTMGLCALRLLLIDCSCSTMVILFDDLRCLVVATHSCACGCASPHHHCYQLLLLHHKQVQSLVALGIQVNQQGASFYRSGRHPT